MSEQVNTWLTHNVGLTGCLPPKKHKPNFKWSGVRDVLFFRSPPPFAGWMNTLFQVSKYYIYFVVKIKIKVYTRERSDYAITSDI